MKKVTFPFLLSQKIKIIKTVLLKGKTYTVVHETAKNVLEKKPQNKTKQNYPIINTKHLQHQIADITEFPAVF